MTDATIGWVQFSDVVATSKASFLCSAQRIDVEVGCPPSIHPLIRQHEASMIACFSEGVTV